MFRKDAGEELAKARDWLAKGEAVRALETARRHVGDRDPGHRTRAMELVTEAREALVRNGLEKSAAAEAAGDLADAADWMRAALQHVDDDRRAEMEARLHTLERRAEIGRREPEAWEAPARRERSDELADAADAADAAGDEDFAAAGGEEDPWLEEDDGADFDDPETRYALLVDTLEDAVAVRYAERPAEFRDAWLRLNDGEVETAAAAFDRLLPQHPDDPVLHFERGRCRLLLGDHDGARRDLEAAWPELGDAPLDRAATLRVPTLWAEAALAGGDAAAVLERVGGLADPAQGDADLSALYATALVESGDLEEARGLLASAVRRFPKRPDLALALAGVLHRLGERGEAIGVLERSVAPSCAGGSCARPPLHLPSLRSLVALHLGVEPAVGAETPGQAARTEDRWSAHDAVSAASLDRVEDLMRWIAGAQGGRLSAGDQLLAARYHEVCGDAGRAEEARGRARILAAGAMAAADDAAAPVGDLASATGKAAL